VLPDIVTRIITLVVNPLIYVLFGAAVLYFLWGVLQFVRHAESSEERSKGAQHIIWGLIGLAIMMSAFGIVRLVINTVGVPQDQRPTSIQQLR
jgi:uncharacterized membrane protein